MAHPVRVCMVVTPPPPRLLIHIAVIDLMERLTSLSVQPESIEKELWFNPRGGILTYFLTGTCHFARKIGTHNSVNSGGF